MVTVGFPFDLAKTRLQSSKEPLTLVRCISNILTKDGVLGLYRGMSAPLMGASLTFGLTFWGLSLGKTGIRSLAGIPESDTLGTVGLAAAGGL